MFTVLVKLSESESREMLPLMRVLNQNLPHRVNLIELYCRNLLLTIDVAIASRKFSQPDGGRCNELNRSVMHHEPPFPRLLALSLLHQP